MSQRQKKQIGAMNNININIKLKVESKGSSLVGKKISNHKQINQNNKDLGRSNISTETLNKKKLSMKDNYCKSKRSVEQFINEHTISYENNESEDEREEKKTTQKPTMARNDNLRQPTKRDSKRMKSKSLENLKIKYYQRSMQKSRQSFSKSKQKSNTKRKNQKPESPKSFIRTGKEQKSLSKQYSKSKSRSLSKSRSKSKSKSKSPLQISKKKSLQIFRIQQTILSKEKQRQKSKDKKTDRSKQKSSLTAKKHSHDLQRDKHKISTSNINKKYSAQIKKQLNKRSKSNDKIKGKKNEGDKKPQIKIQEQTKQNKRTQSKKKQSTKYIYHELYLNKMVTKIQSLCRGYIARKKFQHELDLQTNKQMSLNKISQNWNLQSDNSIICIDSESQHSVKSSSNKPPQIHNKEEPSQAFNPIILQELEKLRKKIQEQEGRFKVLQQQNNQLKANLSKMAKQPNNEAQKQQRKQSLQLESSYKVSYLRINSQQNQSQKFTRTNERNKMLELPIAIKTEQSNIEIQYIDLKKKVQMFECSPKNGDMNFKFSKNVIKKLFLKEEEKLNEKYFRKNRQYQNMLQDQIVSPKTFNIRRQQLQKKIDIEKQQALIRFKQAQKALLLVAELQQDDHNVDLLHKKQNHNSNNSSLSNSKHNSPSRKALNLYINVDEIDSDSEKYHPVLANHYHRENEFQSSKEEEDLSLLYKKAMSDKLQGKRCDQYLKEEYCEEAPAKYNSPELQIYQHQEQRPGAKLQQSRRNAQSKGFQTNLRYIRVFYIKFCEYFRQISVFKEQILNNISNQMTFDLQLFLKSYRASMDSRDKRELIFPYFKQLATYNLAIPVHILNSFYEQQTNPESTLFNKACLDLKELSKMEYSSQGFSFYELKQYHDLALIDAFNQALNFQRPGGSQASNIDELTHDFHAICKGKIKAKFEFDVEERVKEQNFDIILGNSIGRVINNWAFNLCGFLNDSEDPEEQVQEEKLQQIRQIRLTLMLEKTLIEQEINIINMSSFNFYVKFDLELKIFDMLMQQFLKEITPIKLNKSSR